MALPNAYQQYKNSRVLTASPAELTLMLYDGAIKFCNIAKDGCDEKDIQKAHYNITRAEKIIDHLRITLDTRYPVSQDFERIYTYLSRRLTEANLAKDTEILEEVITHLRSVRDTWKEVMRLNAQKGSAI